MAELAGALPAHRRVLKAFNTTFFGATLTSGTVG